MSRETLLEMARNNARHAAAGTVDLTDDIVRVPAHHYHDEQRWRLEMSRVFRRLPMMLAAGCELREPGDYKALEAAGLPVLISRGEDGEARAFMNVCRHRGSAIMPEGCGNARRFTCPYHAWSYSLTGELRGMYSAKEFGDVDKATHSLIPLPCLERAGLIWVIPNPDSNLDIENFLCGYDQMLEHFNFKDWHMFAQRTLEGPNWKIAYDGYLDFYHLPILHKDTFGADFPSQAFYHSWGPHQRVSAPNPQFNDEPEERWSTELMIDGVWTIFPHVSIASFDGGGRGAMVSQLFPGDTPLTSFTVQNYLMESLPEDEETRQAAHEQFAFLEHVVKDEDYATGLRQQRGLMTGKLEHVLFGRNEEGGQNFHAWLDRVLETPDDELNGLFGAVATQQK